MALTLNAGGQAHCPGGAPHTEGAQGTAHKVAGSAAPQENPPTRVHAADSTLGFCEDSGLAVILGRVT